MHDNGALVYAIDMTLECTPMANMAAHHVLPGLEKNTYDQKLVPLNTNQNPTGDMWEIFVLFCLCVCGKSEPESCWCL